MFLIPEEEIDLQKKVIEDNQYVVHEEPYLFL